MAKGKGKRKLEDQQDTAPAPKKHHGLEVVFAGADPQQPTPAPITASEPLAASTITIACQQQDTSQQASQGQQSQQEVPQQQLSHQQDSQLQPPQQQQASQTASSMVAPTQNNDPQPPPAEQGPNPPPAEQGQNPPPAEQGQNSPPTGQDRFSLPSRPNRTESSNAAAPDPINTMELIINPAPIPPGTRRLRMVHFCDLLANTSNNGQEVQGLPKYRTVYENLFDHNSDDVMFGRGGPVINIYIPGDGARANADFHVMLCDVRGCQHCLDSTTSAFDSGVTELETANIYQGLPLVHRSDAQRTVTQPGTRIYWAFRPHWNIELMTTTMTPRGAGFASGMFFEGGVTFTQLINLCQLSGCPKCSPNEDPVLCMVHRSSLRFIPPGSPWTARAGDKVSHICSSGAAFFGERDPEWFHAGPVMNLFDVDRNQVFSAMVCQYQTCELCADRDLGGGPRPHTSYRLPFVHRRDCAEIAGTDEMLFTPQRPAGLYRGAESVVERRRIRYAVNDWFRTVTVMSAVCVLAECPICNPLTEPDGIIINATDGTTVETTAPESQTNTAQPGDVSTGATNPATQSHRSKGDQGEEDLYNGPVATVGGSTTANGLQPTDRNGSSAPPTEGTVSPAPHTQQTRREGMDPPTVRWTHINAENGNSTSSARSESRAGEVQQAPQGGTLPASTAGTGSMVFAIPTSTTQLIAPAASTQTTIPTTSTQATIRPPPTPTTIPATSTQTTAPAHLTGPTAPPPSTQPTTTIAPPAQQTAIAPPTLPTAIAPTMPPPPTTAAAAPTPPPSFRMCHLRHLTFNPTAVLWSKPPAEGGITINTWFVPTTWESYKWGGPVYRVTFPDGSQQDVMACRRHRCKSCNKRASNQTGQSTNGRPFAHRREIVVQGKGRRFTPSFEGGYRCPADGAQLTVVRASFPRAGAGGASEIVTRVEVCTRGNCEVCDAREDADAARAAS